MPEPVIVPRANHPISRRDIDPDALRVLQRLHHANFAAYLVGGSVRDLLLGRHPKDFDIGTDAHPYQIKKLFRNCWIIGRRFRLAHIKFGPKTIEVATFRKYLTDAAAADPAAALPGGATIPISGEPESVVVGGSPALADAFSSSDEHETGSDAAPATALEESAEESASASNPSSASGTSGTSGTSNAEASAAGGLETGAASSPAMLHRDNTFGTPEEDAFRRDFTVNGLFYDIGTFAIIDYVGGLEDLERRVIRSIGDPLVRFVEDPVRMIRAAVFASRLGFDLDSLVLEAIAAHRALILKASPSRLMEEYFKILRSGYAEATFRALGRLRLLELMTPELKSPPDALWDSLARLDAYRQRSPAAPPELTNTVLIGALLAPLGLLNRRPAAGADPRADRISFGVLPVPRRDIEGLRHAHTIVPRLTDPLLPPRLARSLPHRPSFLDALTWLEIFGDAPDAVTRWKLAHAERAQHQPEHAPGHGAQGAHGAHGPQGQGHHPQPPQGHDPSRPHGQPGNDQGHDGQPGRPRRRRRRRRRRPPAAG